MKYLICLLFLPFGVIGQTVEADVLGLDNPALQAKEGTYEIIVDSSLDDDHVSMTASVLREIESNRKDEVFNFIDLAPSVKVKIYPRNYTIINPTVTDEK